MTALRWAPDGKAVLVVQGVDSDVGVEEEHDSVARSPAYRPLQVWAREAARWQALARMLTRHVRLARRSSTQL